MVERIRNHPIVLLTLVLVVLVVGFIAFSARPVDDPPPPQVDDGIPWGT
jgi:hypothetical protein